MIRYRFQFWGRVQKVGFRRKMYYLSIKRGLTGWAMNVQDGSVIAEIQGDAKYIEEVISALMQDRFIRISNIDKKEITPESGETGFGIRR